MNLCVPCLKPLYSSWIRHPNACTKVFLQSLPLTAELLGELINLLAEQQDISGRTAQ